MRHVGLICRKVGGWITCDHSGAGVGVTLPLHWSFFAPDFEPDR